MVGFEKGTDYTLQAKFWKRMNEDTPNDDNPDISDLIGRAELSGLIHQANTAHKKKPD